MGEKTRKIDQLNQLIALAQHLGFSDDVAHYKEELKKVQNG